MTIRVDARKLAELLQNNQLRSVYHGDHGLRTLKELVRSYLTASPPRSQPGYDSGEATIYRSWAIPCNRWKQVYAPRHRAEWLAKISEPGSAPASGVLLPAARCAALPAPGGAAGSAWRRARSTKPGNCSAGSPRSVPGLIRAAVLLGILQTPHRFRTNRQLWTYGRCPASRRAKQRGSPCCERTARTEERRSRNSRAKQKLQSRSEKSFQGERRSSPRLSPVPSRSSIEGECWLRACGRKWRG